MTRTLWLAPLLMACSLGEGEETIIDGSVTLSWQVGSSGCAMSGVDTVEVDIAGFAEQVPCTDGQLTLDVPPGDHSVLLLGLDAGGVARYQASGGVTVREGEAVTMPTAVLGAIPATLDVSWYFENGRLCGGNGVSDVEIVVFDNDFIVDSLATSCDDGIERLSDLLAGSYTITVLGRDGAGAVAFSGYSDLDVDKGDLAFVEVMLTEQ